jgi:hypothetical protein
MFEERSLLGTGEGTLEKEMEENRAVKYPPETCLKLFSGVL